MIGENGGIITKPKESSKNVYTRTIGANWVEGNEQYTNTCTISELSNLDTPHITPQYDNSNVELASSQREAWSLIYDAKATNGEIIFYAFEAPEIEIPIQIEVIK